MISQETPMDKVVGSPSLMFSWNLVCCIHYISATLQFIKFQFLKWTPSILVQQMSLRLLLLY